MSQLGVRERRGSAALALAIASSALVLTQSAHAFKHVSETETLTTPELHTLDVRCPGKQRVLGGGETNDGDFAARVQLTDTAPFDAGDRDSKTDDGWTVSVDLTAGSTLPVKVTVEAVCAKGKAAKKLRYRSQTASIPSGDGVVEASCGKRKRVVSGGVSSPAGSYGEGEAVWITSTAPVDGPDRNGKLDDAWEAGLGNYGGALGATAHAVCAKGKFGRKLKRRSDSEVVEGSTQGTATATCPGRTEVVGGGLETPVGLGDSFFNATGPLGTDAWTGVLDQYPGDVTITAHAICHK